MTDVLVVGALHLDVVVTAERLPVLDETLMGNGVAYRFGGKGGNQALAAARMGAKVAMAGRVGDDSFATSIMSALKATGVDYGQVRQVSGASGMSVAIVESGGEYGAVVVSGVNQTIDPAEVATGSAPVILLQNEIPEQVNLAVALSKAGGSRVVLNAAPARACASALLQNVDLLVANRLEASQMTGSGADDDIEVLARRLADLGPSSVIVTAGKTGCLLLADGSAEWIEPPAVSTGSAHGAGDAFVGALSAEIARGVGLHEATQFAALSAAHFVQIAPDKRAQIRRQDVEAWGAAL